MKMIKEEKDFSIRERKQAKRIEGKGSDKEFKVDEVVPKDEAINNDNEGIDVVDKKSVDMGQNNIDKELVIEDESGWSYEYVD